MESTEDGCLCVGRGLLQPTQQISKQVFLFSMLASLFCFIGCYTFSGTTLPAHLKTVLIQPAENQTLEPVLADDLTKALMEGFRVRSNLRQLNAGGDCELNVTLKQYSHRALSLSQDLVTSYRIDLILSVKFMDKVKNQILYEETNLPSYAQYSPQAGETETLGKQRAVESAVKVILDNTVAGW